MPKESHYNTVNSEIKDQFVFVIVILNVLPNSVDREKCKAGYCLSSCTSLASCFAAAFDELKYCLWSREGKTPDWNIPRIRVPFLLNLLMVSLYHHYYQLSGLVVRVSAVRLGGWGSIPSWVIPKIPNASASRVGLEYAPAATY